MRSIEQVFAHAGRMPRLLLGTAVFITGFVLVGIGTLSIVYRIFEPVLEPQLALLGALSVTELGTAIFLLIGVRVIGDRVERTPALIGAGCSAIGAILPWVIVQPPATGEVLPAIILSGAVYGSGILLLFISLSSATLSRHRDAAVEGFQPQRTSLKSGRSHKAPSVSDGGTTDDGLHFPIDEEDDK